MWKPRQYNEYTHLGRVSAFTGLPTLIGWGGHETQWRFNWLQQPQNASVIDQRIDDVTQIYTNPDSGAVMSLLRRYHVNYVYVGQAERQRYPTANLGRFASFLRVIYHDSECDDLRRSTRSVAYAQASAMRSNP